jgi:integrase
MRQSEILFLTWEVVDLQNRFIRLMGDRTKTGVARSVPLHPGVWDALSWLPKGISRAGFSFGEGNQWMTSRKRSRQLAPRRAWTILRFTIFTTAPSTISGWPGTTILKIMAISGHKTMNVFRRYNLVTEEELSSITWQDQLQGSAR